MGWKNTVYYSHKNSVLGKKAILFKSANKIESVSYVTPERVKARSRNITQMLICEAGQGFTNSEMGRPSGLRASAYDKEFLKECFFNQCFDKGRLKNFVLWFLKNYGQNKTVKLVEQLKNIGFEYASKAGISLGIDDLKIPYKKKELIFDAEKNTTNTIHQYVRGEITGVERFQRLIDTWHSTSEGLKQEVIDYFEATDILNPVYMMAFSGARGNISQVRQLVGMRGLMADPQGQIIDYPIRSNFREGLTITEYLISSYGARKGIVDTALRTANAGYLTRRLVDVAQHVIISHFDCGTHRGIFLKDMKEGNKTIHSLIQRVVGRILARDLIDTTVISKDQTNNTDLREYPIMAKRNQEINMDLAFLMVKKFDKIFVRSPLTCETNQLICQMCYGWSLGQGSTLVSIGEAVGVVAAQSIGEPGTQLTMRTFHTGGVFSGDISDQIRAPFDARVEYPIAIPGTLVRTPEGKIAFLTKGEGSFTIKKIESGMANEKSTDENSLDGNSVNTSLYSETTRKFKIPSYTLLYIRNKQSVYEKEVIAQISTISRKSNATDAAELTISSEYEGQFYSKTLDFREKFVGDAKLIESTLYQLRSQKNTNSVRNLTDISQINPNDINNRFNVDYIDKLYEAWNWGYAWVLSGKIYELNLRGESCFPLLGDLVNSQSSMNQTQWNFHFNNGPAKIYYPLKQPHFGSKNLSYRLPKLVGPTEENFRREENSLREFSKFAKYQKNLNKDISPSNVTLAQPLFFLDILKIRFQKYGYILTSRNKSSSFIKNFFPVENNLNADLGNDLLFRMYAIQPHLNPSIEQENDFTKLRKKQKQKGKKTLLHWFPYQSQTPTGGFMIFEKVFKNSQLNSKTDNLLHKPLKIASSKTQDKIESFSPYASHSDSLNRNSSFFDFTFSQKQRFTDSKNLKYLADVRRSLRDLRTNLDYPQHLSDIDSKTPLLRSDCTQSPLQKNIYVTPFFERKTKSDSIESTISSNNKLPMKDSVSKRRRLSNLTLSAGKQSYTSSLKAEYFKKLKTELSSEKLKNPSVMEGSSFFKLYKFKGLFPKFSKLIPLTSDIVKSRKFGMRWKNSYELSIKSRLDFLYSSNKTTKENLRREENSLREFSKFSNFSPSLDPHKLKSPSKENINAEFFKKKFEDKLKNDDLNVLFNKRVLWIPKQFLHFSRTGSPCFSNKNTEFSNQKTLSNPLINSLPRELGFSTKPLKPGVLPGTSFATPSSSALFFKKPPLFIQTNRQGNLKSFTSFITFPSLLTTFNSLKNYNKTFSLNSFKKYQESSFKQSLGFSQNWNYCEKKSHYNNNQKELNGRSLYTLRTASVNEPLSSLSFNTNSLNQNSLNSNSFKRKSFNTNHKFSKSLKNILFGPSLFHFITFSSLVSFLEKKNNRNWLTPFKEGDSFCIPSTDKFFLQNNKIKNEMLDSLKADALYSQKNFVSSNDMKMGQLTSSSFLLAKNQLIFTPSHIHKFKISQKYRYSNIISNSIKRQIKKLNCFEHKEQLAMYLLSLNFKQTIYNISPYLNDEIKTSIQKSKSMYSRNFNRHSVFPSNTYSMEEQPTTISRKGNINSKITNNKNSKNIPTLSPVFFKQKQEDKTNKNKSTLRENFLGNLSTIKTKMNLQKGWVYLTKNPSKMLSYHKTIIHPGQVNDLQLNSSIPLYLECHTITDIFNFKKQSFLSSDVLSPSGLREYKSTYLSLMRSEFRPLFDQNLKPNNYSNPFVYSEHVDVFSKTEGKGSEKQRNPFSLGFQTKKCIKNSKPRYILPPNFLRSSKQNSNVLNSSEEKVKSSRFIPSKVNFSEKNLVNLQREGKKITLGNFLNSRREFSKFSSPSSNGIFKFTNDPLSLSSKLGEYESKDNLSKMDFRQEKRQKLLSYLKELQFLQNECFFGHDTKEIFSEEKFSNTIILLIQPIEEYNRMNTQQLKTYVHESTLKEDPLPKVQKLTLNLSNNHIITKDKFYHKKLSKENFSPTPLIEDFKLPSDEFKTSTFSKEVPSLMKNFTKKIFFRPFLSSFLKKKFFESHQYNKQKIDSQELTKFPTSDIKIYPLSIDNNFAMEISLGNEKIQTPYYRSLNKHKRPINFSPFFLSFNKPMGVDSIFKDQHVSLSYQPFSNFDSLALPFLSSHLSSFFQIYLNLKMNPNLPNQALNLEVLNSSEGKVKSSRFIPSKVNLRREGKKITLGNFLNSRREFSKFSSPNSNGLFKFTNLFSRQFNITTSKLYDITQSLTSDFIPRLMENPCFSFQNISYFNNPVLTFENLQRDFFSFSSSKRSKLIGTKNKSLSSTKLFPRYSFSGSPKSSTLFSYSQRNETFLGLKPVAKTNIFSPFNGEVVLLNVNKGCMVLTTSNLMSYYLAPKGYSLNKNQYFKEKSNNSLRSDYTPLGTNKFSQNGVNNIVNTSDFLNPIRTNYSINNILVKFLNMTDVNLDFDLACKLNGGVIPAPINSNTTSPYSSSVDSEPSKNYYRNQGVMSNIPYKVLKVSNLVGGQPKDLNIKVRLGEFCVYGDPITNKTAIQTSGQLIHYNSRKITLRRSQPIFISPKGILHKIDNDFVDSRTPVITLSYQKLKTGDIIQGIPKVEQFFEARTTKRGRFFRDSLPYLLKSLFKRYSNKLPLDLAVRQSFYKIQQILVDGVHRVYKAQGVTISDKHLEVIVKQMTSKVRVIDGAQTGFFPGEVLDLFFVEKINSFLMKKITYEPLVLGITKASLEVDSFLSAASFQQTTRVLSKAAIFRKKDFLKGLKENVILGNLIPAGTGYLVYIDL